MQFVAGSKRPFQAIILAVIELRMAVARSGCGEEWVGCPSGVSSMRSTRLMSSLGLTGAPCRVALQDVRKMMRIGARSPAGVFERFTQALLGAGYE